jgi:endonuclease/exonuclease/phosphatase family metal-dependent hydrolase
MTLKIISYNIHKGFGPAGFKFTLAQIKSFLKEQDADIVFLQEVVGEHTGKKIIIPHFKSNNQVEFLAQDLYPYFIYGPNKIHKFGHHGNAILSKYPLTLVNNHNISQNRFESRGLLHAYLEWEHSTEPLHLFNTHLNLFEHHRQRQLKWISSHIHQEIRADHSIILAGDFNDWRKKAIGHIESCHSLMEAFTASTKYPKSFPSFLPGLSLDRIFYMNLQLIAADQLSEKRVRNLSDHLPLWAQFGFN